VAYRSRNLIERMFCRLKDFRRIATRYDKRADTYLSAVLLAATEPRRVSRRQVSLSHAAKAGSSSWA